ncbi:MAG: histidine phosphatase family protein, partial [Holophagae bacterium]|nr:histidine phosphatase family protein [Holophagae bacterium]
QARAVTAVRGILKDNQGQTILLVTHGAFIKVVLAFFEGRDFDNLWEPPSVDNLAHSIIEEKNNGNYEIVLYNNKKWRMK